MFQQYWLYIFTIVLSIAPVVFLGRVIWASYTTAASGSIRRIIIHLAGFAIMSAMSIAIMVWAFQRGLPAVSSLFVNNPATAAINDAGLQLAGAIDTGGLTLPSDGGTFSNYALPSLPSLGTSFTAPSSNAPAPADAGGAAPSAAVSVTAALPNGEPLVKLYPLNSLFGITTTNAVTLAATSSYIVQSGDNLNRIAGRFGVDMRALCNANGLSNCNLLRVGQKLEMPGRMADVLQTETNNETSVAIRTQVNRQVTAPVTFYTEHKLNQSYLPKSWTVLEQGEMSIGEPANMSVATPEVLFSSVTK